MVHDIVLHYGIPKPGDVMFPKWSVCGLYFHTGKVAQFKSWSGNIFTMVAYKKKFSRTLDRSFKLIFKKFSKTTITKLFMSQSEVSVLPALECMWTALLICSGSTVHFPILVN